MEGCVKKNQNFEVVLGGENGKGQVKMSSCATKGESTDAHEGGGSSRSSVEGSAMGLERWGSASSQEVAVNPVGEIPPRYSILDLRFRTPTNYN